MLKSTLTKLETATKTIVTVTKLSAQNAVNADRIQNEIACFVTGATVHQNDSHIHLVWDTPALDKPNMRAWNSTVTEILAEFGVL